MQIEIGTPLIHPVHGPTVLVDITTRTIGEVSEEYAVLEHTENDLVLHLPVATLDEHELRAAMNMSEADDVLEILESPAEGQGLTWRRMRNRNQAMLTSGAPEDIAIVVRDLTAKKAEKGISPSERTMLRRSTKRLIAELDLALDGDAGERVEEILQDILAEDEEAVAA